MKTKADLEAEIILLQDCLNEAENELHAANDKLYDAEQEAKGLQESIDVLEDEVEYLKSIYTEPKTLADEYKREIVERLYCELSLEQLECFFS